MQSVEFMTFNVESEFFSLFVHGHKTAESQDSLGGQSGVRQQPWVAAAIFCKALPNPLDKKANEYEDEMVKVMDCHGLQGEHGFEPQEECQWALVPPTDVEGFVGGKIWAIARVGDTSDVRKVEKQRLHTLWFDEARAKYSDIAGSLAANKLKGAHQHQIRGFWVTKAQYIHATMDCMENGGVFNTRYDRWLYIAANVLQDDGSRIVRCLKQTRMPTGADQQ